MSQSKGALSIKPIQHAKHQAKGGHQQKQYGSEWVPKELRRDQHPAGKQTKEPPNRLNSLDFESG